MPRWAVILIAVGCFLGAGPRSGWKWLNGEPLDGHDKRIVAIMLLLLLLSVFYEPV